MLRPHLQQAAGSEGDDVVLANTGLECFGNILIHAIDHGSRLAQEQNFVLVLDLSSVQHDLLAVVDCDTCGLELAKHGHLDHVDADRHARDALFFQDRRDLLSGALRQPGCGGDSAL